MRTIKSAGVSKKQLRRWECAPLALASNLVLDIVDGVTGRGATLAVLGIGELVAEDLVVLVLAD